jgi:3-hydroxyacyl-[acyl-carrier-protein] dehydratase
MVEAAAQACAIVALTVPENQGKLLLFAGIDKVRFKRIVSPGDELTLVAELGAARGNVGWANVEARVGTERAFRGLLMSATE